MKIETKKNKKKYQKHLTSLASIKLSSFQSQN